MKDLYPTLNQLLRSPAKALLLPLLLLLAGITPGMANDFVAPAITSFSPVSAKAGQSVVITGTSFTGATAVSFGGVAATSFTVNSATQITAVVGTGATGDVSVTTSDGTGTLTGFTYIAPPVISSVSPLNGEVGSSVTITGTGFGNTIPDNKIFFGPVQAVVTAASTTSVTAQVPTGSAYRVLSLTANNFTAQSPLPFNVTFLGSDSINNSSFQKTDFAAAQTTASVTADFDGDGRPDIVSGTSNGFLLLYRNTSVSGALSLTTGTQSISGSIKWMTTGDMNGDGRIDIVAIKHGSGANSLVVFRNTSTPGTLSFSADATAFYPAYSPASLVVTDIDGDGKPDIVAVNETAAFFSVVRNTGVNGSFAYAAAQHFALLNSAKGTRLVTAQFTNDGKPDLAILTNLGLSTFVNNSTPGNLSFGTEQVYTAGVTNRGITTGDVNNDGLSDVAITYINGSNQYKVGILTSSQTPGNFSLSSITELATLKDPLDIILEDFTGDAKPDIAVVNKNSAVATVYRNSFNGGAVSFDAYDAFAVGQDPLGVTTADFNGDGKPDICTTNRGNNTLSILQFVIAAPTLTNISPKTGGPGTTVTLTGYNLSGITGVFFGGTPAASYNVVSPTTITAVTGDGTDGLVTVTTATSTLSISGFTFVKPKITSFSPAYGPAGTEVTITGLNFSSNPDSNTVYFGAVKATIISTSTTSLTVLAPAGATWQPLSVTCFRSTGYSSQPFILAYGGNAILDSASFSARVNLKINTPAYGVAIGDFNGDGKPDLVCSHEAISVYINTGTTGNPSYAAPINLSGYGDVAVADFNGDRKLDIVARNYGEVNVFLNTTTGGPVSFTNAAFEAPLTITRLAVGDFDGDSRPDIALAGEYTNNITILRNSSTSQKLNFSILVVNPPAPAGQNTQDIIAADFNGDGKAELVVTDYNSVQAVVYKNVSVNSITFVTYPLPLYGYSLACAAGDLDADGKPDLVISKLKQNSRTGFSVFKNTSTGGDITFVPGGDYETDYEAYGMAITDITGDSKPDVVAANGTSNAKVSIFRNTSAGGVIGLAAAVNYATGNEPLRVLAGDLNGDGKPDVVTAQGSSYYSPAGLYILYSLLPDPPPALTGGPGNQAVMTMKAGPNPFVSSITLKLDSAVSSKSKLLLIDVNGNILHSQQYEALPAGSSIKMTKTGLKPGFYYLVLQTAKGRSILRVIKQ
jgi:hypothetical protein